MPALRHNASGEYADGLGSRRIRLADLPEVIECSVSEATEESEPLIAAYNTWAALPAERE